MSHELLHVLLHPNLADRLDACFGPRDTFAAIDQLHRDLPRRHAAADPRFFHRQVGRTLHVFRGRYTGFPLGFSYVQIDDELHVLDVWPVILDGEVRRPKYDVLLGRVPDWGRPDAPREDARHSKPSLPNNPNSERNHYDEY